MDSRHAIPIFQARILDYTANMMRERKGLATAIVLVIGIGLGLSYGMAAARYRLFPYELAQSAMAVISPDPDQFAPYRIRAPKVEHFDHFKPEVDFVMIGDSLTEGALWSEIFPTQTIANRGVSGETTEQVLARMDTILVTRPHKAFIMLGSNDLARGATIEEVLKNYREIISALETQDVEIVIQSAVQRSRPIDGDQLSDQIVELNAMLRRLAAEKDLKFVDIDTLLSGDAGLRPEYSYDGTHLTALGYKRWSDAIRPEMQWAE